jgi:hypothetical protein
MQSLPFGTILLIALALFVWTLIVWYGATMATLWYLGRMVRRIVAETEPRKEAPLPEVRPPEAVHPIYYDPNYRADLSANPYRLRQSLGQRPPNLDGGGQL